MKRHEVEHIIRASGAITNEYEFVIVGSQSILGQFPDAPDIFLISREADIYPLKNPEKFDLIDGAIGENSRFDKHYGYYAQGVGPETAVLPKDWEERLIRIQNENTGGFIGFCLEVHDLAVSKLVANRPKDIDFIKALFEHQMITESVLQERIKQLDISAVQQQNILEKIAGLSFQNNHDKKLSSGF